MKRINATVAAMLIASLAGATAASAAIRPGSASEAASVESLVEAAKTGDQSQVERVATQLRMQPRPVRGNRKAAREMNDQGLAFWQRQRFSDAVTYFKQAHEADASDAEIAENLGYALLRAGNVAQAEPAILEALALGPERASAWGSLGSVYAKQGKHQDAVACLLTAYHFALNPKRARDLYSRMAASDEDPKVRAALVDVVTRLPK